MSRRQVPDVWRAYYIDRSGRGELQWIGDNDPEGRIPDDWVRKDLPGAPRGRVAWDDLLLSFEPVPPPVVVDRVDDLLDHPIIQGLSPESQDTLRTHFEDNLPREIRFRWEQET